VVEKQLPSLPLAEQSTIDAHRMVCLSFIASTIADSQLQVCTVHTLLHPASKTQNTVYSKHAVSGLGYVNFVFELFWLWFFVNRQP